MEYCYLIEVRGSDVLTKVEAISMIDAARWFLKTFMIEKDYHNWDCHVYKYKISDNRAPIDEGYFRAVR